MVQVITASVLLPFVLYVLCDIMEFGRALGILLSSYRADDVGGLSGLLTEWKMLFVWRAGCWVPNFVVITFDSCSIKSYLNT